MCYFNGRQVSQKETIRLMGLEHQMSETYLAGRLLRRLPGWGGLAEAAVPMFVIAVVLALALK